MELEYPSLEDLDTARVTALKEVMTSVAKAYQPDVDLRRGVVQDQVITPRALLSAATEQAVLTALNSGSLSEAIADPAAADSAALDRVLGNYRITRAPATIATGAVSIVVSSLSPTVIAKGTAFVISGQTFLTTQSFAARTDAELVISDSDRLLVTVSGGYSFSVDVSSSAVGAAGNVKRAAVATMANPPAGFVRAYATRDFVGGSDEETNTALLARLQAGLAVRAWSNRPSVEAVIRNEEQFAGLKSLSVIGFGDAEMLRDQHSIFPISTGGRVDLYARLADTYQTVQLSCTATLISKVGSLGTWQFGITRDDAPGYYEITKILPESQDESFPGFQPSSDVRSHDVSGGVWTPDVTTAAEAAFSRYQASVVQFSDTVTNATSLTVGVSQATYSVIFRLMPGIDDLQDFWNDIDRRPTASDVLVKAPVPCFTSTSFTLNVLRGYTVDTAAVQLAVVDAINGLGFAGSISASYLNQVLHNAVSGLVSISGLNLSGRIRRPDGTNVFLSGTTGITVPNDPSNGVTNRTVAFMTESELVAVTVVTVDTPGA
jgi:hypothetical protein